MSMSDPIADMLTRIRNGHGKYVVKSKKYHAHDEIGCNEGDKVEIAECRPLSKTVSWTVTKVLEKAVVL